MLTRDKNNTASFIPTLHPECCPLRCNLSFWVRSPRRVLYCTMSQTTIYATNSSDAGSYFMGKMFSGFASDVVWRLYINSLCYIKFSNGQIAIHSCDNETTKCCLQ